MNIFFRIVLFVGFSPAIFFSIQYKKETTNVCIISAWILRSSYRSRDYNLCGIDSAHSSVFNIKSFLYCQWRRSLLMYKKNVDENIVPVCKWSKNHAFFVFASVSDIYESVRTAFFALLFLFQVKSMRNILIYQIRGKENYTEDCTRKSGNCSWTPEIVRVPQC